MFIAVLLGGFATELEHLPRQAQAAIVPRRYDPRRGELFKV
jgi:hypothetical protein